MVQHSFVKGISFFILFLLSVNLFAQKKRNKIESQTRGLQSTFLSGEWDDLVADSMILELYNENFLSEYETKLIPPHILTSPFKNGFFSFKPTGIESPSYFVLKRRLTGKEDELIIYDQIIEENDSIHIQKRNGVISFTGRGAEKYALCHSLNTNYKKLENTLYPSVQGHGVMENLLMIFKRADTIKKVQLQYLNENRNGISSKVYNILLADIIGKAQYQPIYAIGFEITASGRIKLSDKESLRKIKSWEQKYLNEITDIPQEDLALSKEYVNFLLGKGQVDQVMDDNRQSYFTLFKEKYDTPLRDKLLSMTIIQSYEYLKNPDSLVNDALSVITNPEYQKVLKRLNNEQKVGNAAPPFSLPDTVGNIVSLLDFKGKVVFIDFWFTGCTPCLHYYKNAISVAKNRFRDNKDVIFISISRDKAKELWIKSVNSNFYTSGDAYNLYTGGQGDNHSVLRKYFVNSYPKSILIDRLGNIRITEITELGGGNSSNPNKLIENIENALTE